MEIVEQAAGDEQVLVLYRPADTGTEIEPGLVFQAIAADAARRAGAGQWIITMTAMPLRHAGTAFGQEGSGYETKAAVAVVYGRLPAGRAEPANRG